MNPFAQLGSRPEPRPTARITPIPSAPQTAGALIRKGDSWALAAVVVIDFYKPIPRERKAA